jgi:hypothetical protein
MLDALVCAQVSFKTAAQAGFAPSSPLQMDRADGRRLVSGDREAAVLDKKKARRMSDAPSNKTYGNCLLGLHCSHKTPAGNRTVARFLVVAGGPQEKFYTAYPQHPVEQLGVISEGLPICAKPDPSGIAAEPVALSTLQTRHLCKWSPTLCGS